MQSFNKIQSIEYIKGAIWNFSFKTNPFLLPVCEGFLITYYKDPLVRFCY